MASSLQRCRGYQASQAHPVKATKNFCAIAEETRQVTFPKLIVMATLTSPLGRSISRETYLTEIKAAIADLSTRNRNILVYYGEPDLTLQFSKTMYHTLNEEGQLCALVDGEGLKSHTASPPEAGLSLLRSSFREGGVDFSYCDIAYWRYWSARYPHIAINAAEFSQIISRADQ